MFLHGLAAEYGSRVEAGALPEGSAVASWLAASVEGALDACDVALDDFAFLRRHFRIPRAAARPAGGGRRFRCLELVRRLSPGFGSGAIAATLRNLGAVGFGRKEETFLALTAFRAAHAAVLPRVADHWIAMGAEYRGDDAAFVADALERESRAERAKAAAALAALDPQLRAEMRTVAVANGILAMQRDAILDAARCGLLPPSEREILLEQVLDDLDEVAKHGADRKHDEHVARGLFRNFRRASADRRKKRRSIEWVSQRHGLGADELEVALTADGASPVGANAKVRPEDRGVLDDLRERASGIQGIQTRAAG